MTREEHEHGQGPQELRRERSCLIGPIMNTESFPVAVRTNTKSNRSSVSIIDRLTRVSQEVASMNTEGKVVDDK